MVVAVDDGWGGMAFLRDRLLRDRLLRVAEPWGESNVAEIKAQLDSLGPVGCGAKCAERSSRIMASSSVVTRASQKL